MKLPFTDQVCKEVNSPIFVVGIPRSGTTLTAKLLGTHSRIFMPGETHFFDDVYSRKKQIGNPIYQKNIEQIIERLSTIYSRYNELDDQRRIDSLFSNDEVINKLKFSCRTYRDILSFFMETQMRYEGKVRWGNNVPRDLFNVHTILSFYPDAKILICVRDVRDCLVSYREKWKVTSAGHTKRLRRLYHPVVTTSLWKSSMKFISSLRKSHLGRSLMIVRYEELVSNPSDMVLRICRFINEKFEPNMLNIEFNNSSCQTKKNSIFVTSIGRWRKNLCNEETVIAQWLTAKELIDYGYTLEQVKLSLARMTWLIASTPFAVFRTLHSNAGRQGSTMSYLTRRITPLIRGSNPDSS